MFDFMESNMIAQIATMIIGLIAGLGGSWKLIKKYLAKAVSFAKVAKEAIDILISLELALKDDKITKEESDEIIKEARELRNAINALNPEKLLKGKV